MNGGQLMIGGQLNKSGQLKKIGQLKKCGQVERQFKCRGRATDETGQLTNRGKR